jgi:hypothetical protein
MMHRMPILRLKNQALAWMIENVVMVQNSVVVRHDTTACDANRRLPRFVMPVSTPHGIVHAVDVKYPLDGEWYLPLNHRQISAFVRVGFQLHEVCHLFLQESSFHAMSVQRVTMKNICMNLLLQKTLTQARVLGESRDCAI